ncbi:MAG TPA: DUF4047 domain-containing protein [Pseudogracilibacillus sp.]|nr:DUF4047 domain-containing protein [Pseudogracilibacillus sp.]
MRRAFVCTILFCWSFFYICYHYIEPTESQFHHATTTTTSIRAEMIFPVTARTIEEEALALYQTIHTISQQPAPNINTRSTSKIAQLMDHYQQEWNHIGQAVQQLTALQQELSSHDQQSENVAYIKNSLKTVSKYVKEADQAIEHSHHQQTILRLEKALILPQQQKEEPVHNVEEVTPTEPQTEQVLENETRNTEDHSKQHEEE